MSFTPDPEVQAVLEKLFGSAPPSEPPKVGDVESRRQNVAAMFSAITPPIPADVTKKDYTVAGSNGHQIKSRLYKKAGAPENGSGILYLHGGAYIAGGGLDLYDGIIGKIVTQTGVPCFAPDYRLAPEAQYPTNVDDAHKALLYFFEKASEFGIDPKRIAVMGDSGGGGLSAALVVSITFILKLMWIKLIVR
jgi:acetyl esterase/lipase